MSINTLLLCARCIDRTGYAKKTKQHRIGGTSCSCCLFSSFLLAFTYVKELELPAINVDTNQFPGKSVPDQYLFKQ